MRLNKTHKEKLLDFALERTTIEPKEIAKHEKMTEKFLITLGEYFAKEMGADYSSLKRQKCLTRLSRLKFRIYSGKKDKYNNEEYKDHTINVPSKEHHIEIQVPITENLMRYGQPYYKLPKSVINVALKYKESKEHFTKLKTEHRRAFQKLLDGMTTFKRACEVFPEFENAAHLIMSNTQLATTNAEYQKSIKQFKVVK